MTSFNLNNLLKTLSPNTFTLRVRASGYEFWGDTIQFIAISFNSQPNPEGLNSHYTDEKTGSERPSEMRKVMILTSGGVVMAQIAISRQVGFGRGQGKVLPDTSRIMAIS